MLLPCQHNSEDLQSSCRICYLFATRPDYAKIFRNRTIAQIKQRNNKPCIYLGALVNQKPSCGCGAQHKCAIYGECVINGKGAGKWRVCTECSDYKTE